MKVFDSLSARATSKFSPFEYSIFTHTLIDDFYFRYEVCTTFSRRRADVFGCARSSATDADAASNDIADASFYAIADDFSRRGGRGKCRFDCHFQFAARAGNRAGCRRIVNTFAFATH